MRRAHASANRHDPNGHASANSHFPNGHASAHHHIPVSSFEQSGVLGWCKGVGNGDSVVMHRKTDRPHGHASMQAVVIRVTSATTLMHSHGRGARGAVAGLDIGRRVVTQVWGDWATSRSSSISTSPHLSLPLQYSADGHLATEAGVG